LTTRVSKRLGCYYFNRKGKFTKRKQMLRISNSIRQTEKQDNKPTRPRQDPESPLRR
jgi:hypothetical protein